MRNSVRHILILLSFLLLSFPLFGQSDKPCYVSVTSSDDFNQTLLSNISISVISQYLKNVKPFPPSGLSGKEHCIYEVTATLDGNKTFVTLQGNNLNSFGNANMVGIDGFQQAILRSIYRSQRDKRGLICSDYPKILEECGDVVKVKKPEVAKLSIPKKVQLEETKGKPVEKTKPKRDCSQKWECIVPPCDFIDEDGCLIED
jgi:hypothetical protein